MSYIGNSLTQQSFTGGMDQFNGNASNTAFGLSRTINTAFDVEVYVESVFQRPGIAYNVSANTITFTSAPSAGSNNVVVVYKNFTATTVVPAPGSVTPSSIAANTVQASLGYIPANRAGDTFTGATAFSNTVTVASSGITFNDNTQFNTAVSFGMRNKIINGGLDVWQRATSFTDWGSFAYLVDRMRIGYDGSPASGRTLTRQTFDPGQTGVPEGDPKYYMQYAFPSCGTPTNYLRWDIESVRTLAGKQATFSFWARVPSGTMTIGVAICQEFGSGGSPSSGVYPTATNYTVTTTWQKFVYTTTVASITGKTIGTNNDDRIWPAVWFPPAAAGTIHMANFQLEEGTVATPFEKRPYGLELALCQRYYCKITPSTNYAPYAMGHAFNTTQFRTMIKFPQTMRATPTLGFSAASTFQVGWLNVCSAIAQAERGTDYCSIDATTTGLTSFGAYMLTSAATTASYITADAEL
jgi:hypothetical protein